MKSGGRDEEKDHVSENLIQLLYNIYNKLCLPNNDN